MFSEVLPSEPVDHASQSVPMVSTSTPGLMAAGPGDDRDDVFLEPDADRCALSLHPLVLL